MPSKLPPGPSDPRALQAFQFLRDPRPLLERAQERYGDVWTLRMPRGVNNVLVADPALAHEVLTATTTQLLGAAPPVA